jgi:hypothetical protein
MCVIHVKGLVLVRERELCGAQEEHVLAAFAGVQEGCFFT